MKKQDITYQDKFNELRLDMSHPNSKGQAFVLVEGDSDIRLFRKLFDTNHCKVERGARLGSARVADIGAFSCRRRRAPHVDRGASVLSGNLGGAPRETPCAAAPRG